MQKTLLPAHIQIHESWLPSEAYEVNLPWGAHSGELIELPVNVSVGRTANYATKLVVCGAHKEAPVAEKKNEEENNPKTTPIKKKKYERELRKLQTRLVEMQEWIRNSASKVVIVFEGRDAAGKGGVIHRIMERVSPRIFHHVALPAPTDREKSQLYAQRYMKEMRQRVNWCFLTVAGTTVLSSNT